MTAKEYFESITKKEIDLGKVEKIQNIYNKVLPEEVQRIVSNAESSIFWMMCGFFLIRKF